MNKSCTVLRIGLWDCAIGFNSRWMDRNMPPITCFLSSSNFLTLCLTAQSQHSLSHRMPISSPFLCFTRVSTSTPTRSHDVLPAPKLSVSPCLNQHPNSVSHRVAIAALLNCLARSRGYEWGWKERNVLSYRRMSKKRPHKRGERAPLDFITTILLSAVVRNCSFHKILFLWWVCRDFDSLTVSKKCVWRSVLLSTAKKWKERRGKHRQGFYRLPMFFTKSRF